MLSLGINTNNQITNTGFNYDAAGNLTADGTGTGSHNYTYDAENHITQVDGGSTATYTYDAGRGDALVLAVAGQEEAAPVVAGVSQAMILHGAATAAIGTANLAKDAAETSASGKPYESTPENQDKMKQGKSPTGNDGHPVELHHEGQKPNGPVKEMTRTEHRLGENFKKNHPNTGQKPSQINRNQAQQQKRKH
jgi:YD repeat-containing protein